MKTLHVGWLLLLCSAIIPVYTVGQTVVLTASKSLVCIGESVSFTLTVTGGTPTKVEWDEGFGFFMDLGGSLTEQFFFSSEEEFLVRSRVSFGATVIIDTVSILVGPPPLFPQYADFASSTTLGRDCGVSLSLACNILLPFTPPDLRFGYEVTGPSGFALSEPVAPVSFSSSGYFYLEPALFLGELYSDVMPGTYKVRFVSDYGQSCPGIDSLTFILPDTLLGNVTKTDPVLGNDGAISVAVQAGNGNSLSGFVSYQGISNSNRQESGNQSISIPGTATFSNLPSGQYEVIFLDEIFPCWSTEIVTLDQAVALDYEGLYDLEIYPNPTKGGLLITGLPLGTPFSVRVSNMLGQWVYHQAVSATQVELDLSHLGTGIFRVHLVNEANQYLYSQLIHFQ